MIVSIIYASLSGNTKLVSNIIEKEMTDRGFNVSSVNILEESYTYDLFDADLLFIGSYTWGDGKTPKKVIEMLRDTIKEKGLNYPPTAVFGTGETQWTYFCRAVDEISYHISKHTDFKGSLKIEQSPLNGQTQKVKRFVQDIIKEMTC